MACMFLQPRRCRGSLHIAVIGRLDQDTAEHFARSVEKLTRSGVSTTSEVATDTVLDLRCCTALDDQGASALASLLEGSADGPPAIRLANVPPLLDDAVRAAVAEAR